MAQSVKGIKQRYFDNVYKNAEMIECACGCGKSTKNKDKYGRDKRFINGHNTRKYEDPAQHKREWNKHNKEYRYELKEKMQKQRKSSLIKYKGGRCEKCGMEYDGKNGSVFQFHHTDPSQKLFQLSLSKMWKSLKALYTEADKCKLLCANCHFTLHSSEY